jgi:uncharacterized protein (TIGR02246 family)
MRIVVIALALGCLPATSSTQPSQGPEAAIRERHVALAAAINKRDAGAVSAFFAPDGDEVFFDRSRLVGPEAIRQKQERQFATWPATQRFTLDVTGIRMLTPEIAIVETLATFSEGEMKSNRGTAVMVRKNGKWLIAALRVYPAEVRGAE